VKADASKRFERLKKRGRPGDVHEMADLSSRDEQQVRMGLEKIESVAKLIVNEGSLDDYLRVFEELIQDKSFEEFSIAGAIQEIGSLTEVLLQDAILVALLDVWREDEARVFYTTTEIAGLTAQVFPSLKRAKHKDNVSRYFNQDSYVYYEVAAQPSARRYRLSNTGYGMAVQRLRSLKNRAGRRNA
jgi:hypothetical protein